MNLQILFESAWNASIVPFGSDTTFYAMQAFGNFDMRFAALFAVIGGVTGQLLNWCIGRLMRMAGQRGKYVRYEETYTKAEQFFNKYLIFLLVFSWLPVFKFLVLAAGFLQTRFRIVFWFTITGYIAHYTFALF